MQGKSFFLRRVVARPAEWQMRYPALTHATSVITDGERPKEIIVAAADEQRVRMVFFSSFGSILDFEADWRELAAAHRWLQFTLRWNRWWLPNTESLAAITAASVAPTDVHVLNLAPGDRLIRDRAFCEYLDVIEARHRRYLSLALTPETWHADSHLHREPRFGTSSASASQ